jgi:hypothetical protein
LAVQGVLNQLSADWERIQSVAPLISQEIQCGRRPAGNNTLKYGWHAETIFELLRGDGFLNLTFRESHEGNCATITATKP